MIKECHTKFDARSYHSFNDILDQSHHYNNRTKRAHFSHKQCIYMYWSKLLPLPIVNFHEEGVKIQPVEPTSHW